MKKWASAAVATVAVLAAVLSFNAARFGSRQIDIPRNDEAAPAAAAAAQRLAQAVRFQTISHQDVVPIDPASADKWLQPQFGGVVSDGFIWGRGTLDDKGAVMALHEAAETLLAQGFRPKRIVYFAFGHDEEVGGREGSAKIAEWLSSQRVRLESLLDEGQAVTEGIVPGFDRPVAPIGIAEKGYLSLEFVVEAEGGHSSMPPAHTAVGVLSAAIARLEDSQFPATISDPVTNA